MTITDIIMYSAVQVYVGSAVGDESLPEWRRWATCAFGLFMCVGMIVHSGVKTF